MVKWKLFSRSKSKDQESAYAESTQLESEETMQPETEQEPEKQTLAEYNETLYSQGTGPKKIKEAPSQATWRDIDAIEENVDNLRRKTKTKMPLSEIDKTVDRILSKKRK